MRSGSYARGFLFAGTYCIAIQNSQFIDQPPGTFLILDETGCERAAFTEDDRV